MSFKCLINTRKCFFNKRNKKTQETEKLLFTKIVKEQPNQYNCFLQPKELYEYNYMCAFF